MDEILSSISIIIVGLIVLPGIIHIIADDEEESGK
jgi:hypothetical protein